MDAQEQRFLLDLRKFTKGAPALVEQVMRSIALDLGSRFIADTPKDTGRATNGWQVAMDKPETEVLPPGEYPRDGAPALGQLRRFVGGVNIKGKDIKIYFSNNVPYIIPLEMGHSKQAPAGMVRVNLANFPGVVARNIAKARGGGVTVG